MKLRITTPLLLELHDQSARISVPPLTRGQMRRLYELEVQEAGAADPKVEAADLRASRLGIMLERGVPCDCTGAAMSVQDFLDKLTPQEECEIMAALIAQFNGIDPSSAVDLTAAILELQKKKSLMSPSGAPSS